MGAANTSEVDITGPTTLKITRNPTASNTPEIYKYANIKGVVPVMINTRPAPGGPDYDNWKYRFDKMVVIDILFTDGGHMPIDLQEITNQPTWTANLAGQQQAIADIQAVL